MFSITVNGQPRTCEKDVPLLEFLREDLGLTAAKKGCDGGVCGACTVLVDGKKRKACTVRTSKLDGHEVLTVEGIDPAEMDVYRHCFAEAGAVQCGYCIPGMVISAKALLDENLNPTRADVKRAIKGNLCRCTGYKKIEDAILMAAEFFRTGEPIPAPPSTLHMDERAKRFDAAEKVDGTGVYVDDIHVDGMLFAKPVYARRPRARIDAIDVSPAADDPRCVAVFTKKDVPHNVIGHIKQDWDVMMGVGDVTRYVGNVLALVVAEDEATADELAGLVKVGLTELEPVTSPFDGLRADAPLVHPDGNVMSRASLRRGDADSAIRSSAHVVTRKYKTSWQEHGFMEPECCLAMPEGPDRLLVYVTCQSVYDVQRECSAMLGVPPETLHVRSALVGGGFGGKEDMSVQQYAVLAAWLLRRPVKVRFTRQESLDYHVKRHPMEMEFTTACDEEGHLTACKAVIIADTGAYASLGGPVLERACTHAAGPYNYQNLDIFGMSVYTNNVVSGAYRGFGVTQSCFATEQNINLLAKEVGIDPWEMRKRNVVRPGDVLPNGQTVDANCQMEACLDALKEVFYSSPYTGIAMGFKNSGTGMGKMDVGRVLISVEDGKAHLRTSAACMGQGVGQVVLTEVCDVCGLDPADCVVETADTDRTPDSGTSTASRQTVVTGEAARRAAEKLGVALEGRSLSDLEGREFFGEYAAQTDELGAVKENPVSHVSYSYGAQVVVLDDEGRIERAVSAFDVGTPVNIQSVEGQIEGGMVMGIGYGVTERFDCVDGYPTSKFGTIGFMRADEAPELDVILCRPDEEDKLPFSLGAKGCGELCMIPTAPACALAYERFDGEFRNSLPLSHTPYRK